MFEAVSPSRELWQGTESIGPYAERGDPEQSKIDRFISESYAALVSRFQRKGGGKLRRVADAVDALAPEFADMSEVGLRAAAQQLRAELTRRGFEQSIVVRAFALIRRPPRDGSACGITAVRSWAAGRCSAAALRKWKRGKARPLPRCCRR
jgi:hypothetical protein